MGLELFLENFSHRFKLCFRIARINSTVCLPIIIWFCCYISHLSELEVIDWRLCRVTAASIHALVATIRYGPNCLRARKYMCVSGSMAVCSHLVNIVLSTKGRDASAQPQPCRKQLQFYFGHFF